MTNSSKNVSQPSKASQIAKSIACAILSCVLALFISHAHAHELQPAVANISITNDQLRADIDLQLEPLVLGMDLAVIQDTDDAPEAQEYDTLRALEPAELKAQFEAAWPDIQSKLELFAGTNRLIISLDAVDIPEIGDVELSRISKINISANLPDDESAVTFGWAADLGGLIVRQNLADGDVGYAELLASGGTSEPMPREGAAQVGGVQNFLNYIVVGFEHIIPKGLDHILFVLGLFFFSLKIRPLILQVTAFTLAHTITLALASLGYVFVPANIVEPLIALSIAFVALENIRGGQITTLRMAVVFAFGLLHGLGFAFVLGDVGLAPTQFISSLIAFNIGVELGQLSVIAIAFVVLALPFGEKAWYRKFIAIPCSILIALVGIYWTIERVFF